MIIYVKDDSVRVKLPEGITISDGAFAHNTNGEVKIPCDEDNMKRIVYFLSGGGGSPLNIDASDTSCSIMQITYQYQENPNPDEIRIFISSRSGAPGALSFTYDIKNGFARLKKAIFDLQQARYDNLISLIDEGEKTILSQKQESEAILPILKKLKNF